MGQARVQVAVGNPSQVSVERGGCAERGQAPLGVVTIFLQVLADERLQQRVLVPGQGAALDQDLAQGPGLVRDPGVEGGQQHVAIDEVVL